MRLFEQFVCYETPRLLISSYLNGLEDEPTSPEARLCVKDIILDTLYQESKKDKSGAQQTFLAYDKFNQFVQYVPSANEPTGRLIPAHQFKDEDVFSNIDVQPGHFTFLYLLLLLSLEKSMVGGFSWNKSISFDRTLHYWNTMLVLFRTAVSHSEAKRLEPTDQNHIDETVKLFHLNQKGREALIDLLYTSEYVE